jgi:organic radical activating enzyme
MDNFCSAPFRGFYQGLDGKISVCCQAPVLIDNNNYEEAVHDEKIKKLRRSFLANKIPEECSRCPRRVREETTAQCKSSNENFTVDHYEPVFLDLLWSNKCNFACMGCNPRISSFMLKYKSAVDIVDLFNDIDANYEWNSKDEQQNRIDYILKNIKTIKSIHLNGGEPLMQEGFYDLLERLIELNLTHIGIWAHTNGSISKYKGKNIVDLIKPFDICDKDHNHDEHELGCKSLIVMSHDGIGDKGEYVRYGLKQNVWLRNYKKFTESGIKTDVQVCYNIFNCLDLEKMADWYDDQLQVTPSLSLWTWPPAYSAKYIRKVPKLYDQAMSILETHGKRFRKYEYVLDYMKEPVKDKELEEMHWRFSESILKFDELRNTDFLSTFPELKELYY